ERDMEWCGDVRASLDVDAGERIVDAERGEMARLGEERERVHVHEAREQRVGACERSTPELREGMVTLASAVVRDHVVRGLRASVVTNDHARACLADEEIDDRSFALVAEAEAGHERHRGAHNRSTFVRVVATGATPVATRASALVFASG